MNLQPNVIIFCPDQWGEVDKFSKFYAGTHSFGSDVKKAVSGIRGHFDKAITLRNISMKLVPNLKIDQAELIANGFTSASNATEFAAVVEGVFTELYSSVDCARKVVTTIYKKCRGIPDSTRKFFTRAVNGEISDFPPDLRIAFTEATWYGELLGIRDELTHSNVGSCYQASGEDNISYMHQGMIRNSKPLVINDIFKKIEEFIAGVNQFLGRIFNFLNSQLLEVSQTVLCGFFHGRAYVRDLIMAKHIDFNSGICNSKSWFDTAPEFMCPFASQCGAYKRAG